MKELTAHATVYVVMQADDYMDIYEQDGNKTVVIAVCDTRETAQEVFTRTWDALHIAHTPNAEREFYAEDEIDEQDLTATRTIYDSFGVPDATHKVWAFKSPIVTNK